MKVILYKKGADPYVIDKPFKDVLNIMDFIVENYCDNTCRTVLELDLDKTTNEELRFDIIAVKNAQRYKNLGQIGLVLEEQK